MQASLCRQKRRTADLEADLQQLSSLDGVILQRLLEHGLESSPLAVRVVPQKAKA